MSVRHRVLAVDDNQDTLELIRISLQDDYDVLTLANPMDIFEMIELFQPDLLVLDVMMPKITGFQLVEMLNRPVAGRNLPIIILSAKDSARDIKHGYKLGASLYLTKPFQPERLLKNVKMQFEAHPPSPGSKKLGFAELRVNLEQMPAHKHGNAQLGTSREEEQRAARRETELRSRFGGHWIT